MTARNLVLIPLLGYASGGMLVLGSIGFFYGVFDRMGFFRYRTPKSGSVKEMTKTSYFQHLTNDRNSIVELVLGGAGLLLAWFVFIHGVWFLAISMLGFGLFTLKSMNLSRNVRTRPKRLGPPVRGAVAFTSVRSQTTMAAIGPALAFTSGALPRMLLR